MIATLGELAEIRRHAEAEYPSECCGVILVREAERVLMRCRNAQDELHAKESRKYSRTSRKAYHIDSRQLLEIYKKCDSEGYQVAVIYHSHCDTGAYFSETDTRNALVNEEPAHPDVTYVVVSIVNERLPGWVARRLPRWCLTPGRVAAAAAFRWDTARRDFFPVPFSELPT